jgi:hypothetical protein
MGMHIDQAWHDQATSMVLDDGIGNRTDLAGRTHHAELTIFDQQYRRRSRHSSCVDRTRCADQSAIVDRFSTGFSHHWDSLQPPAP